jgi:hypothetical protein
MPSRKNGTATAQAIAPIDEVVIFTDPHTGKVREACITEMENGRCTGFFKDSNLEFYGYEAKHFAPVTKTVAK